MTGASGPRLAPRRGLLACTCPPGSGDGPRVAHCHDRNSPYKRNVDLMYTGYVLREVGPFTSEVQHAKEIEI